MLNQTSKFRYNFFYGYVIVIALFITQFFMCSTRSSYGLFFKPILVDFGWNRAFVSGAYSISMIIEGLSGIIMGRLNDKIGPRLVVALGGILIGMGYLLTSQVNSAFLFFLFYSVIVGMGMGTMVAPQLSTIARWFDKKRGVMSSILMAGGGIGGFILPPVLNWLISTQKWRTTYTIMGAVCLLIIVSAAQFLRRDPASMGMTLHDSNKLKEQKPTSFASGFSLEEALHSTQLWMFVLFFFCFGFCVMTIMVHIVPYATDMGISEAHTARTLSIIFGAILIGSLLFGNVIDRFRSKRTLIFSFALILIALLWLRVIKETWMLYLFAGIIGMGHGGVATVQSPIIAEFMGLKAHGAILGITVFASAFGGAVGPYVAGYTFDISGSYLLIFNVLTILSFCGLILASTIRPAIKIENDSHFRNGV